MTSFEVKYAAVVQLYSTGKSATEIFKLLHGAGYSRSFVFRAIKRHNQGLAPGDGRGRLKKRTVRTTKLIKKVRSKLMRNPARSARKMAQEYDISKSSMQRLLKQDLHTHAYKFRKAHMMTMEQRAQRKKKCPALLSRFADVDVKKIIFSDEKMLNIEAKWNAQNNRVYAPSLDAIPDGMNRRQRSLHPASVMVWGAVSDRGNSSLCFLDKGVKVNQHNYLVDILQSQVKPLGERLFPEGGWCFQQDSAPAHKAKLCQQWCSANLPDFISWEQWPAASPDLNPLDFYVWSRLEQLVCTKNYPSIAALKMALTREWSNIPQDEVRAAIASWRTRLRACARANGGYFE